MASEAYYLYHFYLLSLCVMTSEIEAQLSSNTLFRDKCNNLLYYPECLRVSWSSLAVDLRLLFLFTGFKPILQFGFLFFLILTCLCPFVSAPSFMCMCVCVCLRVRRDCHCSRGEEFLIVYQSLLACLTCLYILFVSFLGHAQLPEGFRWQ